MDYRDGTRDQVSSGPKVSDPSFFQSTIEMERAIEFPQAPKVSDSSFFQSTIEMERAIEFPQASKVSDPSLFQSTIELERATEFPRTSKLLNPSLFKSTIELVRATEFPEASLMFPWASKVPPHPSYAHSIIEMERAIKFPHAPKVNRRRFLAEVFKVVYLGGEEVPPEKQLGTIKVRNNRYHHYIYNIENADTIKSSIKHGEELTLTGPTLAPISCPSGYLVIEADLFCGAFKGSTRVNWVPFPGEECGYLERRIKSKKGPGEIIIFLGMFFCATEALLEVSLFTKDSSDVSVGGVVAARTSNSVKAEHSSSLFSEKTGCNIKVQSGESIPLSRSIIVLPLSFELFLDINLSCDDEIIAGILKFEAALNGTFDGTLIGRKCEVKAKVTWNVVHESAGALNDRWYSGEESDEDWLRDDDDESWLGIFD